LSKTKKKKREKKKNRGVSTSCKDPSQNGEGAFVRRHGARKGGEKGLSRT